jgi:hypothetical protein
MPVYQIGDLVKPSPATWGQEDNLDAVGLIIEMRSGLRRPEVKVLWNDLPGYQPNWVPLRDIVLLEGDEPSCAHLAP